MSRREDIQNSIWGDPDFEVLSADAKLLYLWSFTNPLCNMSGVYKVSELRMARDTSMSPARVTKALDELRAGGFIVTEGSLLWVRSRVKHMRTQSPTMARSIEKDLEDVPAGSSILAAFLDEYATLRFLSETLAKVRDEKGSTEPKPDTPSKGSPEPQQGFQGNGNGYGKGLGSSVPQSRASEREFSTEVQDLCLLSADLIEGNGSKRPTSRQIGGWARDVRLMLEQDGRTVDRSGGDQVVAAARLLAGVVLSMGKLREKYDQMRLQAQRDKGSGNAGVVQMLRQSRGAA